MAADASAVSDGRAIAGSREAGVVRVELAVDDGVDLVTVAAADDG